MTKPFRVKFRFSNAQHDLDFRAHESDPAQVVVKAKHPEAVDNLIAITGVDPGITSRVQGSHNFVTMMPKDGASKLLAAAVMGLATKSEAFGGEPDEEDETVADD